MGATHPFRFRHPVTVRFRDIDGMGHAHHALALVYFEEARWAYWQSVVGEISVEAVDHVLVEARVRWHARVHWPRVLTVGVRVTEIGRRHFEMAYEVASEGERLVTGSTVQVSAARPCPCPTDCGSASTRTTVPSTPSDELRHVPPEARRAAAGPVAGGRHAL